MRVRPSTAPPGRLEIVVNRVLRGGDWNGTFESAKRFPKSAGKNDDDDTTRRGAIG